ncbi:energy transducer TonB [Salmonirosea aquatica]|uniref:Uncharacterized protein n=1 Tax=Salmonirosea aquatica TaxID=2654236 RepID=A0A7C9FCH7_9BACT|nr:hypothetical protein [Cytophagaceae bacterium SJW1-29]
MKDLACLLFLLAATTASFSQANEPLLTTDVIFDRTALKELRFPSEAFRQEKSVRVYVRFTLTSEGEYDDVSIVNSEPVDESFQKELDRFWPKLPKQDPLYAGLYVIPINFLYGERGTGKPKPISNETDTIAEVRSYRILSELPILSYILCEKKGMGE